MLSRLLRFIFGSESDKSLGDGLGGMFSASLGECSGGSSDDRVEIDFNHLDMHDVPNMKLEVQVNGETWITMDSKPIPLLTGKYKNSCLAKKAILEYLKQRDYEKVVETIYVGITPTPTPPRDE